MYLRLMPIFILKDLFFRLLALPEFLCSILGFTPNKVLNIRVLILKKENSSVSNSNIIEHWIKTTSKILESECHILLKVIDIESFETNEQALESSCKFKSAFSKNAKIYAKLLSNFYKSETIFERFGYGAPLNVIVTKSFKSANDGCAIPLITNYVVLTYDAATTTLTHEISHIAWLGHKALKSNIMNRFQNRGTHFTRFQKAMLRTSRYVSWFGQ